MLTQLKDNNQDNIKVQFQQPNKRESSTDAYASMQQSSRKISQSSYNKLTQSNQSRQTSLNANRNYDYQIQNRNDIQAQQFEIRNNLIETLNINKVKEFKLFDSKKDKKMLTERKNKKQKDEN